MARRNRPPRVERLRVAPPSAGWSLRDNPTPPAWRRSPCGPPRRRGSARRPSVAPRRSWPSTAARPRPCTARCSPRLGRRPPGHTNSHRPLAGPRCPWPAPSGAGSRRRDSPSRCRRVPGSRAAPGTSTQRPDCTPTSSASVGAGAGFTGGSGVGGDGLGSGPDMPGTSHRWLAPPWHSAVVSSDPLSTSPPSTRWPECARSSPATVAVQRCCVAPVHGWIVTRAPSAAGPAAMHMSP